MQYCSLFFFSFTGCRCALIPSSPCSSVSLVFPLALRRPSFPSHRKFFVAITIPLRLPTSLTLTHQISFLEATSTTRQMTKQITWPSRAARTVPQSHLAAVLSRSCPWSRLRSGRLDPLLCLIAHPHPLSMRSSNRPLIMLLPICSNGGLQASVPVFSFFSSPPSSSSLPSPPHPTFSPNTLYDGPFLVANLCVQDAARRESVVAVLSSDPSSRRRPRRSWLPHIVRVHRLLLLRENPVALCWRTKSTGTATRTQFRMNSAIPRLSGRSPWRRRSDYRRHQWRCRRSRLCVSEVTRHDLWARFLHRTSPPFHNRLSTQSLSSSTPCYGEPCFREAPLGLRKSVGDPKDRSDPRMTSVAYVISLVLDVFCLPVFSAWRCFSSLSISLSPSFLFFPLSLSRSFLSLFALGSS